MPLVEGREFKLFPGRDNETTVTERIAFTLGTAPGLIRIFLERDVSSLQDSDVISVVRLEDAVAEVVGNGESIVEFIKEKVFSIDPRFIARMWHKLLSEEESNYIFGITDELVPLLGISRTTDVENIYGNPAYDVEGLITSFLASYRVTLAELEVLSEAKEVVEMSEPDIQKENFNLYFKSDLDLIGIFDRIRVVEGMPYVNFDSRHKVHQSLVQLGDEWSLTKPDYLRAFVLNLSYNPEKFQEKNYSQVTVQMGATSGELMVNFEVSFHSQQVDRNEEKKIIDTFFIQLLDSVPAFRKESSSINCQTVASLPPGNDAESFNRHILADILFNNPSMNQICYMDEAIRIPKSKGISFFYNKRIGETDELKKITVIINETDAVRRFEEEKGPPGAIQRLSVRINKATNLEETKIIAGFVRDLLILYSVNRQRIQDEYRKFIPDFGRGTTVTKQGRRVAFEENPLRKMNHLMFPEGYNRVCQFPPVVVDEAVKRKYPGGAPTDAKGNPLFFVEDIRITDVEGRERVYPEAMLFPRNPALGEQHWFACAAKQAHNYPGLRKNTLRETQDIYPELPCCYQTRHSTASNNLVAEYYFGITKTTTNSSNVLTTNKFVSMDELGELPDTLLALLQIFNQSSANFYRRGSTKKQEKHNWTLHSSVMLAVTGRVTEGDRTAINSFEVCKQTNPTDSTAKLMKDFQTKISYVDPRVYLPLLEERYECEIFIFSEDPDTRGIRMVQPKALHGYFKWQPRRQRCVVLFEHMGSESNSAKYPHCEIIMREATATESTAQIFEGDFYTKIQRFAEESRQFWTPTSDGTGAAPMKIIREIPRAIPYFRDSKIEGQVIDSLGKLRSIQYRIGGNKQIILRCAPLPPLYNVREIINPKSNTEEDIVMFASHLDQMDSITEEGTGVKIRHQNFDFWIGTGDAEIAKPIERLPSGARSESSSTSILERFNNLQRTARYLQEYLYWLYSRALQDELPSVNHINSFLRRLIVVKQAYSYPQVDRVFSENSGYCEHGRLIVHNLEVAQRLGYSLEIMIRRYKLEILDYRNQKYIKEYFLERSDFTNHGPEELLFLSNSGLDSWLQKREEAERIEELPMYTRGLFPLQLFGNLVLIQMCPNLDEAAGVGRAWLTERLNVRSSNPDYDTGYCYYIFQSPTDIQLVGNETEPVKILVWKQQDFLRYGAILALN